MSPLATAPCSADASTSHLEAIAYEVASGLTISPRTLSPWLFYDEAGSVLFEEITQLPEYYLTRTERAIFAAHAEEIITLAADKRCITVIELGAGTATKTGVLLQAAVRRQSQVTYQPIDVSESCLIEARGSLESQIPGVTVASQLANYITNPITLTRPPRARVLALYIGSSIGNFSPSQARDILSNLRAQLEPGDTLLLGTDLAPGEHKDEVTLLAAYDDAAGVTAAFNLNILARLNRDLGADFNVDGFAHRAVWNQVESRIEMHLESLTAQQVAIPDVAGFPALKLEFKAGETIHTENSYKFTTASVEAMLGNCGFAITKCFSDARGLFAVTLATAV